ncbi:MAG: Uma2 family endonuclease [Solirubrobacteraceae bacterium]
MTAQELLHYKHEPFKQELIDGILHEMEPPGAEHGVIAGTVYFLLTVHVRERGLGLTFAAETGFQIRSDPDTVRAPDVAFVSQARVEETGIPRGYWPGPPDIAIEVVSLSDRRTEVESKALDWLASGTRAVVVLDPPLRTATVYRARDDVRILTAGEPLDLCDVVEGFAPRVDDCFV